MGWLIRLFILGVLSLGIATRSVFAHDPFDGATRVLVHDTIIEVEITFGSDATREFLKGAGLSGREIATLTRPSDSSGGIQLPATLASHFFEVRAGGESLLAKACMGVPGEAETIFVATYPRPAVQTVTMEARYFSGIQYMHTGPLVAGDDKGQLLVSALLSPAQPSVTVPLTVRADAAAKNGGAEVEQPRFVEFLKLGVAHILTGFDHLLFLCALLIGVRQIRPMLGVITCFTLGHSITLALAALGVVTLSPRIVEPLIAASIIVVGVENFIRPTITSDRYWMAAGFGLIHGFGFASALQETGLGSSARSIIMPLFSFNLGVEVGQILVAAVVVPVLLLLRKKPSFARFSVPVISAVVIVISGYWLLERTVLNR